MTAETRYAVYFVPRAETPLYRFGASVLGYDGYTGEDVSFPDGALPDWRSVVDEPRRYGFHATLKAPFRLANGGNERDLLDAFETFASKQSAVPGCTLDIRELGNFVALTPVNPPSALDGFAHACVEEFDRFRAPMNAKERARRLASKLTPRQLDRLDRWGYPYVFEDFRFHLTLTGPLTDEARGGAFRFLCGKLEQMPGVRSLAIDQIVISRQIHGLAPFRVLRAAPLGAR